MNKCQSVIVSAVALLCMQTAAPKIALAADALEFEQQIAKALSAVDVHLASTVPAQQLITRNNTLVDLVATTPHIVELISDCIKTANREILLQIYEWNDADEAAKTVFEAVQRRVERALSHDEEPIYLQFMVSRSYPTENGNLQRDLLKLIRRVKKDPRSKGRVAIELAAYRGTLMSILHTKTLVVDSTTAVVSTANFNTHGGMAKDSFNMAASLKGPVVSVLRADWFTARRLSHVDACTEAFTLDDSLGNEYTHVPLSGGHSGQVSAAVLSRRSNWTYWSAGDKNPQDQGIIALIDTATDHIDILNPSVGVKQVQRALIRAIVDRGVRVRAVLSLQMNRWREKKFFGGDNVDHAYGLLLELLKIGGPELADRLTITWGSTDGVHPSEHHDPGNIHAKVANFDDQALLIGSTNWNWLSWNNSRELSVALMGHDIARDFKEDTFSAVFSRAAPLTQDDLPKQKRTAADPVFTYLRAKASARGFDSKS